jgi:DNA-binding transcriptional LysR family regulator
MSAQAPEPARSASHVPSRASAELRHLRAFVAVAQEGSFTRAAAILHIGQSSMSKLVRQLEEELGVALFERSTHYVRLTAAGAALFAGVGDPLRAIATAMDAAQAVERGDRGQVRIGYGSAIGPVERGDVVRTLRSDRSQLSVVMQELRPEQVRVMLRRHEIDLAVMRTPDAADVERVALRPSAMELAVPAGHRLALRASVSLPDLDGTRLLVARPSGTPYTDWLVDRLHEADARVELRQAWVVGAAAPLHQLLEDDAVAIVPVGTVPPTGVRCLPIQAFSAPLWLLWAPGSRPAAVRRLERTLGLRGDESQSIAARPRAHHPKSSPR